MLWRPETFHIILSLTQDDCGHITANGFYNTQRSLRKLVYQMLYKIKNSVLPLAFIISHAIPKDIAKWRSWFGFFRHYIFSLFSNLELRSNSKGNKNLKSYVGHHLVTHLHLEFLHSHHHHQIPAVQTILKMSYCMKMN